MKKNKISVITINYNNKSGLEKTIQSVISQTYFELEYIIIDGGSSDESIDVIKKYENKIDYWISEQDKGIYNAMNKGIAQAHGEYCNFMNSGDCFHDSEVLEDVFSKQTQKADIITGNTILSGKRRILETAPNEISAAFLFNATLNHQSTFIKTSLLKENPYNENFRLASDWIFFMQKLILENYTYQHVNRIISIFQMNGLSSNGNMYQEEKDKALKTMFPAPILSDYQSCASLIIRYRKASTIGKKIITLISIISQKLFYKE